MMTHASLQHADLLAMDNRSKVLDAAADGYVRSESCRALWLQPLQSPAEHGEQPGCDLEMSMK
jgi:acyl transferase domain-containing protein